MSNKVVLAYSGGLDTTIITQWLFTKGYEVICLLVDLGQKVENIEALLEKAKACGAAKALSVDAKEEFVSNHVFKALKWNAKYEGEYLLGTSLARPLISKAQIEVAKKEGAQYVSHGATGKGNDQVRFEMAYYALMPNVKIIAPWKTEEFIKQFPGRKEMIEFAEANNLPVKATLDQPWSSDENLMHISFEAGMLEDPWQKPRDEMFELTQSPQKAPDQVAELLIDFEKGLPVAVNGEKLSPAKLLETLNKIGGENAIGRLDMVENRFVGMKSRGVYETPGATILWAAHKALEGITMDRDTMHLRDELMPKFAEMVYYGFWFCEKMKSMDAFIDQTQKNVTGTVRLELYKGNVTITGRKSPVSLYDINIASMDDDKGAYNQSDAIGFIRLNALPQRVQALKQSQS